MKLSGLSLASLATFRRRRIFRNILFCNTWGSTESVSGPGSTRARAASFLDDLIALVRSLEVRTLLDAPCGDFNWAAPLADAVDHYIGVDVVPSLIEAHQGHASPRREFVCRDLVSDPLPAADLVFCRDCLVHLSNAEIRKALENLRRTGARWLVTTTFLAERPNVDIWTGNWRPLNLEGPPFEFPPPFASIDERCDYEAGQWRDKRLGVWEFGAVPRH